MSVNKSESYGFGFFTLLFSWLGLLFIPTLQLLGVLNEADPLWVAIAVGLIPFCILWGLNNDIRGVREALSISKDLSRALTEDRDQYKSQVEKLT